MPGKVTDDRSRTRGPMAEQAAVAGGRGAGRMPSGFDPEAGSTTAGVRRLYTVPIMADVLGVPVAAVRHWCRSGLLEPTRRAGSLEWFDFQQLVVGRRLARLLAGGMALREIDAKLAGLAPGGAAEAARADGRIVADGTRLSIRRGNRLVGAGGQLQLGFYADDLATADEEILMPLVRRCDAPEDGIPSTPIDIALDDAIGPDCLGELLDLAADLEAAGEYAGAAEALRAALQAAPPTARVAFMLAELLYRSGDLTAARERYYAAIELDADHLEARANLGCVLAELGELELSLAALEGVVRQQPDYADAHWHMAGVLRDLGRGADEQRHLRLFLSLAPASPWAKLARARLDG
ncbi:MAG: MerR family transcriptional regulator [Planctomycetia bacterium]|nr:MerR family transcriptional regulator [Planctomycetia bacterium]